MLVFGVMSIRKTGNAVYTVHIYVFHAYRGDMSKSDFTERTIEGLMASSTHLTRAQREVHKHKQ